MSTEPGTAEPQIEGGQDTHAAEHSELIAPAPSAPSAPFNPAATHAAVPSIEPEALAAPQPLAIGAQAKHPLQGWWWKCLLILLALFVMLLVIVWIGPAFIWIDAASASPSNAESGSSATLSPSLFPTLEPTLAPLTQQPTASPAQDPTHSPTAVPTASPTPAPTFCPSQQGSFVDDAALCEITDALSESCDAVHDGLRYAYRMKPLDCASGITCSDKSQCGNVTHYAGDDGYVHEGLPPLYQQGEHKMCVIERSCADSACQVCSAAEQYRMSWMCIALFFVVTLTCS